MIDLTIPLSSFLPRISSEVYAAITGHSQDDVASAMVEKLSFTFEEQNIKTTTDGRKQLRNAFKKKLKTPSQFTIGDYSSTPEDEIFKIVDLTMANSEQAFDRGRYERIGYVVAENIVTLIEEEAERLGRCPAWPFC